MVHPLIVSTIRSVLRLQTAFFFIFNEMNTAGLKKIEINPELSEEGISGKG